jgi:hypothetical protein
VSTKTQQSMLPVSACEPSVGKFFRRLYEPWFLALIITLLNAVKPVMVDDTAYLAYARQVSIHPLDPYGFTFFWYTVPEDAFEILIPPVVPYWLGLGMAVFGEHPALLKVWMYPFLFLFVWAVRELLRRFVSIRPQPPTPSPPGRRRVNLCPLSPVERGLGGEGEAKERNKCSRRCNFLPFIALSPAILPAVNLMIDVPALALGLTAIVLFIRSTERGGWRLALISGLTAGVAMQTKYTAFLVPPVLLWYGLTRLRWRDLSLAAFAVAIAFAIFASWELFLESKYGRSHFLFHLREQQLTGQPGLNPIAAFIERKRDLYPPLTGYLGFLGIGSGLLSMLALGVPRRIVCISACIWTLGLGWIALTPAKWSSRSEGVSSTEITFATKYWQISGTLILLSTLTTAVLLVFRFRKGVHLRKNADALFLAGWLLIELGGYFALTPFGAGRRVISLVVVGSLLAARLADRLRRSHDERIAQQWISGLAIAAAVVLAAIDTLDAFPEKVCAERAAEIAASRAPGSTVWFAGHWGFQYYCTRAGMKQIAPGESVLLPGDMLVLPIHPDVGGFYRPHIGEVPIQPPGWSVEMIGEVVWDDPIAAQTVPNLYGGIDSVVSRDHPRLRVIVFRVTASWQVYQPRMEHG